MFQTLQRSKVINLNDLNDMIFLNKVKFIGDFENKRVLICFQKYFRHANSVHTHKTRFARKNKLSKTRKYKTTKHGINCFTNLSISASNKLKDFHWYKSIKSKFALVKQLKSVFLKSY